MSSPATLSSQATTNTGIDGKMAPNNDELATYQPNQISEIFNSEKRAIQDFAEMRFIMDKVMLGELIELISKLPTLTTKEGFLVRFGSALIQVHFTNIDFRWVMILKVSGRVDKDEFNVMFRHKAIEGNNDESKNVSLKHVNTPWCAGDYTSGEDDSSDDSEDLSAIEQEQERSKWIIKRLNNGQNNNIIHTAVVAGNNKMVRLTFNALEERQPPYVLKQLINAKNIDGATPLMLAARFGNKDAAEMLVNRGANINGTNKEGWTALHAAARWGHFETFQFLLNQEAKMTVMKKNGNTILHSAALGGDIDIIKLVLEKTQYQYVFVGNSDKSMPINIVKRLGNEEAHNILREYGDIGLISQSTLPYLKSVFQTDSEILTETKSLGINLLMQT